MRTPSGLSDQPFGAGNAGLRLLLTPLFRACGKPEPPALGMPEVVSLSLHDLNVEIDLRRQQWTGHAETLLAGTGITVPRRCEIAGELLDDRRSSLSAQERQALVDKGILRVRLAFGGAA